MIEASPRSKLDHHSVLLVDGALRKDHYFLQPREILRRYVWEQIAI